MIKFLQLWRMTIVLKNTTILDLSSSYCCQLRWDPWQETSPCSQPWQVQKKPHQLVPKDIGAWGANLHTKVKKVYLQVKQHVCETMFVCFCSASSKQMGLLLFPGGMPFAFWRQLMQRSSQMGQDRPWVMMRYPWRSGWVQGSHLSSGWGTWGPTTEASWA